MSKRVRGDRASGTFAKDLLHTLSNNISTGGCRDGLYLFTGTFVVAGKEGQGGQLFS
jgi:hypothetical protein